MSELFTQDDLRPHTDTWVCGKCRKPIEKGHRCMQVRISHGKGVNPADINHEGLIIGDEWEMVHVDCRDPFLKRGLNNG